MTNSLIRILAVAAAFGAATAVHAQQFSNNDGGCNTYYPQSPIELIPGVDVGKVLDSVKKYKDAYLNFRCDPMMRFLTNSLFAEFEKDGLTVKQLHDKLSDLIKLATSAGIDAGMIAQLKTAQAILAEAIKDPTIAATTIRCIPNCGKKTVQCSMKAPSSDWVNFPEF